MTEEDKLYWANFRETIRGYIDHNEYLKVCEIYARTFNLKKVIYVDKCPACGYVQKYIDEINEKFNTL